MAHDDEIFGIDRRKAILTGLVSLAIVAAFVAVLGQVTSFREMLRALERADGGWFPLCLAGELAAYAGYIVAYRDVARVDGGPCFSLWTAARVVAIGFGAFVAGTSAGSLGLDFWALHRAGEKPHVAARRVLALNTIEWAVLASLACLAGALSLAGWGSEAPLPMKLAWLAVVPACVAAALWVSSPRRVDRLSSLPHDEVELERDPRTWARWLSHAGRAGFSDAVGGVVIVRHLLARPRRHPGAVLGFPLYWAGDILALWAALRAFGQHAPLPALVLAYTTAYVVTALPLPAGGAGGIEAGVAFSLAAVGIPIAPALLATLVYRVFTLWLPIGPALAALSRVGRLAEELPSVPRAEAT
ncbi:MAG TPA: lysylphosphatidylglycerol synthase transmembrane domain-containing protein [Gaiellaceae bacterium]|nr:lysylphosphatidylglycerol synthase transmembrane domain-containing protein [Gaiellaceae bacterium]